MVTESKGWCVPIRRVLTFLASLLPLGAMVFGVLLYEGYIELAPFTRNERLGLAAMRGNVSVVRKMLERGADVNTTEFGIPLMWAAHGGHVEMMTVLIDAGADPYLEADLGFSPMRAAVQNGQLACIALLLNRGVDINRRYMGGQTALHSIVPVMPGDEIDMAVVRYLLKKGADPRITDDIGMNTLHRLVSHGQCPPERRLECARLLIAAGVDVNATARRAEDRAALHFAAFDGKVELVRLLLKAGADRKLRDNEGRTAYDIAVTEKHAALLPLLRIR